MKKLIFILMVTILFGCTGHQYKNPHVLIVTAFGDIEVELFAEKAPKTVGAFLSYIDAGFYNKSSFYRVILLEGLTTASNTGLIQGGIWQTNDALHPTVPGIVHESTKQSGLSHTSGTISLARKTAGTGSTEFFICIGDQTQLDYGNTNNGDTLGFAAFGSVFKGMSIVRKIQQEQNHDQHFDKKIVIHTIEKL